MENTQTTYVLDPGTPKERRVLLERRAETPNGCYVNDHLIPGFNTLGGFQNWCETLWFAIGTCYRLES
jgi:hypothetical protein